MSFDAKIMVLGLGVLAGLLVLSVLRVVFVWVDFQITRHDLIVESKRRRLDYIKALAERDKGGSESVEVVEDEAQEPLEAAEALLAKAA